VTQAADIAAFGSELGAAIARFRLDEPAHRAEYRRQVERGEAPAGLDNELLERITRRYLIDPMLRALDWNPDDPGEVIEEARSWAENGDRLYFDYLGLARNRTPVLIVEAKGFDAPAPRAAHGPELPAAQVVELICETVEVLKKGARASGVLAQWADWLTDLVSYVRSLGPVERQTLRRVMITAGRWLIIFADPAATLLNPGRPEPTTVRCFTTLDEIALGSAEIFRLLKRQWLTDTLPLTLTLGEAVAVVDRDSISRMFRGVVVATHMSGPVRGAYPTRSIHPTVVLVTGGRMFAVTDYQTQALEEPQNKARFSQFLLDLQQRGNDFEARALAQVGRTDLTPSPVADFPLEFREVASSEAVPFAGSTAAMGEAIAPLKPELVRPTGERGAESEYLVTTGQGWFYKSAHAVGVACELHNWPKARARGSAAAGPHTGGLATSFTASGEDQHCADEPMQGHRRTRCQLAPIETHLCCRACLFHDVCWGTEDLPRLSCPR
jgi:hypothetical protein